jgi:hypothetical protein
MKPCKGAILYFALAGLAMIMVLVDLGLVPQAITSSPLRGFFNQLLSLNYRL